MPENTRPAVGDLVAVAVVHLVAVTVALGGARRAVHLGGDRALGELGRVQAEAHRAAQVAALDDVDLLLHRRDDGAVGVGVELARRRVLDAGDVPRVLDDDALQAEADAERRDALLARELQCADLALDAPDAESAGDDDAVERRRAPSPRPRASRTRPTGSSGS